MVSRTVKKKKEERNEVWGRLCHLACSKSYIAKQLMANSILKICEGVVALENLKGAKT